MNKSITSLYTLDGIIDKRLPNTMFRVKSLTDNRYITCYLCGKLRINYIKIVSGDRVRIELDKTNNTKGRIISRLHEGKSFNKETM